MARIDRKQREFERREEEILDAALALFSQPNWESVSIDKIAKATDIGKGTVYKHFASKDELLLRLMMRFYQGLLVDLQDNISHQEHNIIERFRDIFQLAFRYHLQYREYRYIVEHCNRIDFKERADESWHERFTDLDKAFGEWADPMILAAMEQGQIAKRPLEQVNMGMKACFEGAIDMLWAGKDWCVYGDKEEIIESVTEFMLAGLVGRR